MASESGLRYEWLSKHLKKEELKILCQNRGIDTEVSTKKALIKSLLKSKSLKEYDRLLKQSLILEIKAKGIKYNDGLTKKELIELLNKNKKKKPTIDSLTILNLSELTSLCHRRSISIKDYTSKQSLSDLLQSSDVADPEFTESMTLKQLSAEMKGRGLSISGLNKDNMLKILKSDTSFEEQQLQKHIDPRNVDKIIEDTKNSLTDFIDYIKENTSEIQKLTIKEAMRNGNKKNIKSTDYLSENEWLEFEDRLRTSRDMVKDIRTMVETYIDVDFGKDEEMPQYKKFKNIIDYDIDSEIDVKEGDMVYVVYDVDTELIMNQNKKAVLGVFQNENEAEEYKKQILEDDDEEIEIAIQEIEFNDYWDGWDA